MELFMSTVFFAGLLSFFAPCTFPLIPVYIGILTDHDGSHFKKMAPFIKTMLFVLGLSTTFITLGFGAGALGAFIQLDAFYFIGGALVVIMGFHQMELIRLPALERFKSLKFNNQRKNRYLNAYLLGFTFSFAWTPCVGPVLGAVLVVAADGGQALYGGWLMLLYTIGLAIPFIVLASLSQLVMKRFENLEKHLPMIKKIGGALIVIMGLILMTRNLSTLTAWIDRLF
ncbi:cytochrome c biogenesis CcdA family protein [Fusibacter bizertensis]|jgi:Cytochrome c biogenesis protein|uniref:Cytochrome c biogenesis CcdA family protein n=1 Tax=Fusibacter bizertensis TaxID=1488331 RepID=A0ABT6NBQ1_9FIRM|nr:cytochrome c biogenesis CcdA family protein [Fusibacter bizertensis]MDH8677841.1 cytochrome c biogenesis CcdA family protein [Fusibacter bizertensis]